MEKKSKIEDFLNRENFTANDKTCIILFVQGTTIQNFIINGNVSRSGMENYNTSGPVAATQREDADQKEEGEKEQGGNEQPVNIIFKKFHEGKAIDFFAIRKYIEVKLVNDIKFQYEWYAAYRILDDLRLLDDLKLSSFAEQMNKWFPDAKVPCDADALGDYATGHTSMSFSRWDEEQFLSEKKKSQSKAGFRKLWSLCHEIKDVLKTVPTL